MPPRTLSEEDIQRIIDAQSDSISKLAEVAIKRHGSEQKEHISKEIEQSIDKAVCRTFSIVGVDVNNPASVSEFQADLRFGKNLRKFADRGKMAFAAAIGAAIFGMLWFGAKEWIANMVHHLQGKH